MITVFCSQGCFWPSWTLQMKNQPNGSSQPKILLKLCVSMSPGHRQHVQSWGWGANDMGHVWVPKYTLNMKKSLKCWRVCAINSRCQRSFAKEETEICCKKIKRAQDLGWERAGHPDQAEHSTLWLYLLVTVFLPKWWWWNSSGMRSLLFRDYKPPMCDARA